LIEKDFIMGTRSLTFVMASDATPIVNMYRQFDGYPSGHGAELAEFLNNFDEVVNGIPVGDHRKLANGMGCLAAQLVAHFKTGVGGFYLYPTDAKDCGQEYEYYVYEDCVVVTDGDRQLFEGTWKQFYNWTHGGEVEVLTSFDTPESQNAVKNLLRENVLQVTFTKKDGSTRVMNCTLAEQHLQPNESGNKAATVRKQSDAAMPVWDVLENGWRAFRWDSIKSISVHELVE
jgi:hypothetical protein